MKYCPRCQSTYTDATLQFCLQDGAVLVSATEAPTVATNTAAATGWNETEAPTVVRQTVNQPQPPVTQPDAVRQPEAKKSGTALTIILTALVTLLLVGGGLGAWLLLRNRKTEVAVNPNVNNSSPRPTIRNSSNTNRGNVNASPTPSPSNTNANSNSTPANVNVEQIKSQVSEKVDGWADALESGNLNAHMSNYADRLDYYYNSRDTSVGAVRSDKQRAFASFDDFRMDISNLRVTPDASGEKATAVFDKEWEFEGADNRSKGKAQSQLQLTKIDGAWRITGEKDLKVYYTE